MFSFWQNLMHSKQWTAIESMPPCEFSVAVRPAFQAIDSIVKSSVCLKMCYQFETNPVSLGENGQLHSNVNLSASIGLLIPWPFEFASKPLLQNPTFFSKKKVNSIKTSRFRKQIRQSSDFFSMQINFWVPTIWKRLIIQYLWHLQQYQYLRCKP